MLRLPAGPSRRTKTKYHDTMPEFSAPSISLPEILDEDVRVGHLLGRGVDDISQARAVLLGFPTDEGVRRNGGRPGAARGPEAIRDVFYRMAPDARLGAAFTDLIEHTVDLGDLVLAGALEEDQEMLGETLAPFLRQGCVPIVLGGGHETAFGHFLGYVYAGLSVSILNWDAHPDVRPLKEHHGHSGSSFRQALLHFSGTCQHYTVAGLQPHSTARTHLHFVEEHGGRYLWRDEVTLERIRELLDAHTSRCMVTFDLDAVDHAQAPGVSAPAVDGLPAPLWLDAAFQAGRHTAVVSMDLAEMNPNYDVDHRTARLAALTVWHFLRGLSQRGAGAG